MDDAMKEFEQAEKLAPNEEGLVGLANGFLWVRWKQGWFLQVDSAGAGIENNPSF